MKGDAWGCGLRGSRDAVALVFALPAISAGRSGAAHGRARVRTRMSRADQSRNPLALPTSPTNGDPLRAPTLRRRARTGRPRARRADARDQPDELRRRRQVGGVSRPIPRRRNQRTRKARLVSRWKPGGESDISLFAQGRRDGADRISDHSSLCHNMIAATRPQRRSRCEARS